MVGTTPSLPMTAALRPPLKWAGGKRWLVPHLAPIWKPFAKRRCVEPFCGAMAATLSFAPEKALLNDGNVHLINFYSWVRSGLQVTLWMENDEELYYVHRKRFNEFVQAGQANSAEAAALFYYLNRTGFN